MAQHISPITPGAMANAGTSSRITPRKGGFFQKLGAGIETLVNTAAPIISPEVREFEDLRARQGVIGAQAERLRGEEARSQQEFDRDNRFIDLDTALSTTTPSVRKFLEKEAEERLLSETDPNTGKKGVRFGAGAKFLEEFQKDPNKVLTLNRLAIQDHSIELSRIQKNIEKETNKMAKEIQSLDPGIGEIRAREMVQANMQNPANQSEELRRAFDDKNFINEKINALLIENESLSQSSDTKSEPFVNSEGKFIDYFVPGQQPQGAIPLEVFKETNRTQPSEQRFNIMNSDEYKQDMEDAEQMLRTLREGHQILDENGNPIKVNEQEIIDFVENKYSPISKDVTRRLQPLAGGREF